MEAVGEVEEASKKQRVSFGDVEYAEVPTDCRRTVTVNDIVDLTFVESDRLNLLAHRPDFTHQLFENESVELFAEPNSHPRVTIEVDCSDLSHKVSYSDDFADLDITTMHAGLAKAIPSADPETEEHNGDTCMAPVSHSAPPGSLIHQFTVRAESYEVYLATAKDAGASELLAKAEKLAMWFIETADAVDFSDDRWEAVFLYVRDKSPQPNQDPQLYFAGYMTLFSFRNPFRGTKLRVCQALVLPHRQGLGLGREMLLCVYKHIVHVRSDICELTVEDPALGFQRLRDAVDLECLVAHSPGLFAGPVGAVPAICEDSTPAPSTAVASPSTEQELCTALKIIKAQAQFLLEFVEYVQLVRALLSRASSTAASAASAASAVVTTSGVKRPLNSTTGDLKPLFKLLETSDDFKSFRLKVKRRILKNDKDLASIAPKSEMQKALTEEFNDELKRFHALESTAKRLGLVVSTLSSLL